MLYLAAPSRIAPVIATPSLLGHVVQATATKTELLINAAIREFYAGHHSINLRLPFTLIAHVQPQAMQQAPTAVVCAAALGVTVSPKLGRHSYVPHGWGE
jgi:hypothetical protein